MKFSALSAIFGLFCAALSSAAAIRPAAAATPTEEYVAAVSELGQSDGFAEAARIAPYHVVFVPGLATDLTQSVGELTGRLGVTSSDGFLAAFHQQMHWLDDYGLSFTMVPFNRLGGCDENADVIFDVVMRSAKPVILVTQSKGGVDALHALVRHPSLLAKIKGWVAYQPPHRGSVLADIVQENGSLSGPSAWLLKVLKGTPLTYQDMTTGSRAAWNQAHRDVIRTIPAYFPVVTLITTETGATLRDYLFGDKSKVAFLAPFVDVISSRGGGINDGIASVEGTCLEGAICARVDGIDHFAAVMNTSPFKAPSHDERVLMFRAMMDMTVRRASP